MQGRRTILDMDMDMDMDGERSMTATLNAGRTGDSPATMMIQPQRTKCLFPLATLPSQASGHVVGQFSEAADAEDGTADRPSQGR
jgi:hypothetical protein